MPLLDDTADPRSALNSFKASETESQRSEAKQDWLIKFRDRRGHYWVIRAQRKHSKALFTHRYFVRYKIADMRGTVENVSPRQAMPAIAKQIHLEAHDLTMILYGNTVPAMTHTNANTGEAEERYGGEFSARTERLLLYLTLGPSDLSVRSSLLRLGQ